MERTAIGRKAAKRQEPESLLPCSAGMSLYSLSLIDSAGHVVDHRSVDAITVSSALAEANRRMCAILGDRDRGTFDPKGRIDVLDQQGSPVARIHCADALFAMS